MMKTRTYVALMLAVILVLSVGLTGLYVHSQEPATDSTEDLLVVTSFYPIYIATINVVGDTEGVTVKNMSEPQTGCLHDYQMTTEDMRLVSTADVFVVNGGGIESFIEDVVEQYKNLYLITATSNLELISEDDEEEHEHESEKSTTEEDATEESTTEESISEEDATVENTTEESTSGESATEASTTEESTSDSEEHEHDHGEVNAHAWMSVSYYRQMVSTIAAELSKADPAHADEYEKNAAAYDEKLAELYEEEQELATQLNGQDIVIFHEAYAYLAQDLGLDVAYVLDLDEEREVSAGEVSETLDAINEHEVKYIFAEKTYGEKMGTTMEQDSDVTAIYLNPLTRSLEDETDAQSYEESDYYLIAMRQNFELIRENL
ncbi:MAG: zinc ABC transporter substrate-binding protein [Lachnospiraceae bacterium]|nr:zinc ABC transporter substrate-binding protein [Lachnospiraceae bacterium]